MGLRVIKRSLRTRDTRAAQLGALALTVGYALAFANLRGQAMKGIDLKKLTQGLDGDVRRYEVDVERGLFKTDGSDLEHRRVLEILGAMATGRATQAEAKPVTSGVSSCSLRKMIEHWEIVEMPGMLPATAETRLDILNDFAAHIGEKRDIASIRKPDVAAWVAYLIGTKKNVGNTADTKSSHVKMLFELAIRTGAYPENHGNPAEGAVKFTKAQQEARAEAYGWEAFTLEKLKIIFAPENLSKTREPHTRRAMVIALFTGARVGEIAQLRTYDFERVDGVPCLKFAGEVKTRASRRRIPIHPDLLKLGIMDWVAEQTRREEFRLFPTVRLDGKSGKGNAISKGASKLLRTLKITTEGESTRLGMHSFRDTVIQELQSWDGLIEERRKAYAGHASYEKQDNSSHKTAYMREWKPQEIAQIFGGIRWGKWLDFEGLRELLAQTDSDAKIKKTEKMAARPGRLVKA